MAVETRLLRRVAFGPCAALAAVDTGEGTVAAFPSGLQPGELRPNLPAGATLRQVVRSLVASFPERLGQIAEPGLFAGLDTLVAIRNGESAAAAADWLAYHAREIGAEAALIVDRDPPGGRFADDLAALVPALPVVVVAFDSPLGLPGAPDARDPALSPGAPRRDLPAADPWHSALGEPVVPELLRHAFLSAARAVAFVDIADIVLPGHEGSPFDRAVAAPGRIVLMHGIETYPWRLRGGRAAVHGDHVALRRDERRWLASWAAAPATLDGDVLWQPVRLMGAAAEETRPVAFRRAMGVVFPGVEVNRLVRKADLVEDPALVAHMRAAFGQEPIRLPQGAAIPERPERGTVTVVTAMKNEGPFVLDWIAHNRAIGIERHLVYTNDCEDGTERLLDLLGDAGVTRRDNPFRATDQVPQHAAFRAAEEEDAVISADWLLTLDVDEYVNIHAGAGTVADLLAAVPGAHVISMPWRLFGNADRHDFEDRPVTEQFTRAAPAFAPRPLQAWAFKSLYRNAGLFRRLGVHRPKGLVAETQGQILWVDGAGRPLSPQTWRAAWRMSKSNWGYDLVSLNHYAVRSAESFLVKRDRGRVNHTSREQGLTYWFRMNHNAEEERSISRLSPRVQAEKARLLTLPGVAEAHGNAVEWHRKRIAALRAESGHAAVFSAITGPRLEKLSRMATNFGSAVYLAGPDVIPDEIVARDPKVPFFFTIDGETD